MALVMAMIVVVLITLLVAGAISFTGTERAAAEIQSQEDSMSSCVQAARNLFLSKLNMSMQAIPNPSKTVPSDAALVLPVTFTEDLQGSQQDIQGNKVTANVRTGHLGDEGDLKTLKTWTAKKVGALDDPMAQVKDNMMVTGAARVPTFYIVTAVCREDTTDATSPEREIEFMVRVGF